MERDNDSGGDEDALGVERAGARNAASIEGQSDARYPASTLIAAAAGLGIAVLHVHMAIERVLRIKIDSDGHGATSVKQALAGQLDDGRVLDLRLALHAVVDGNSDGESDERSK
jgi:hypothetical protein